MEVESILENLPNFRQAGGKGIMNQHRQKVKDGLLFRSSRTDFITDKEKAVFDQLGIKSIVDLRTRIEYERAEGEKVLDDVFHPCILDKGKLSELQPSGSKLRSRKAAQGGKDSTDSPPHGHRYLVNMMTMDVLCHLFHQLNFFIRYLSLILVLVDRLCGCQLFMKFFSWAVLNRQKISELYVDILDFSKPAVVDIMRLIVEQDNIPILILCAHGKDRTGMIIAVILACLEVDDEIIAQDYAESEAGLAPVRERLYRETVERYGFSEQFTKAEAETMREMLTELRRRYGSISNYLESTGFTLEEQQKLKDILLDLRTPTQMIGYDC